MLRRLLVTILALAAIMTPLHLVGMAHAARRDAGPLVIYCGRGKSLVEPLLERFERQSGIDVEIRYAGSTDLANLLLEEGRRTPADVFFSQDPGALGAVAERGLLGTLPPSLLNRVNDRYRDDSGRWIGTSGRARVIAWSTDRLKQEDVPTSVFDLTRPEYRGRVGWAPANASFQLFVTAMRHRYGEQETRAWLEAMKSNDVRDYPKNRPVIQAIADGEIDFGLVNHYYLKGFQRDQGEDFPVANAFLADDVGGMMSVAGAGVLSTTDQRGDAETFVEFLLSEQSQRYFAYDIGEFPLTGDVETPDLPERAREAAMKMDLGALSDRQETLRLLRETDVLP
jgi:iron(III) transport system substrate-binding protein